MQVRHGEGKNSTDKSYANGLLISLSKILYTFVYLSTKQQQRSNVIELTLQPILLSENEKEKRQKRKKENKQCALFFCTSPLHFYLFPLEK